METFIMTVILYQMKMMTMVEKVAEMKVEKVAEIMMVLDDT
jgi:hypothetical protein